MVGYYHWPPEDLPILHEILQMSSHLISDGIHLSSHNGEVSIDKGHDGQSLVGSWLPIWGENKLMRPCELVDCCCVGSPQLARCDPWPLPGLNLPLLPGLLIVNGGQE